MAEQKTKLAANIGSFALKTRSQLEILRRNSMKTIKDTNTIAASQNLKMNRRKSVHDYITAYTEGETTSDADYMQRFHLRPQITTSCIKHNETICTNQVIASTKHNEPGPKYHQALEISFNGETKHIMPYVNQSFQNQPLNTNIVPVNDTTPESLSNRFTTPDLKSSQTG